MADEDKTLMNQDAAPQLQYSRGTTIRCANCQCVRPVAATVVADGKRICRDYTECRKLAQHREDELRGYVPSAVSKPAKREEAEQTVWPTLSPRWLNTI